MFGTNVAFYIPKNPLKLYETLHITPKFYWVICESECLLPTLPSVHVMERVNYVIMRNYSAVVSSVLDEQIMFTNAYCFTLYLHVCAHKHMYDTAKGHSASAQVYITFPVFHPLGLPLELCWCLTEMYMLQI